MATMQQTTHEAADRDGLPSPFMALHHVAVVTNDMNRARMRLFLAVGTLAMTGLLLASCGSSGHPSTQSGASCPTGVPTTPKMSAQREAMSKLDFLVGQWSGPATISNGPGPAMHLTQTENVQSKIDGLVLLIEGATRDASGNARFQALATIAYDDTTATYRIRAYNDGNYLDTEMNVLDKGFSWGFSSGPATITNTMHLTDTGQWSENTTVASGASPPRTTTELTLRHTQLGSPNASGQCPR